MVLSVIPFLSTGSMIRQTGCVCAVNAPCFHFVADACARVRVVFNPQGTEDVMFHSIWTDEGNHDADGHPTTWRAIQTRNEPLEFFNE